MKKWILPELCSRCGRRDFMVPLGAAMGAVFLLSGFVGGSLIALVAFPVGWVIGVRAAAESRLAAETHCGRVEP